MTHQIVCLRCRIGYSESHYHCCQPSCRRIFRSAWGFERHQGAGARTCLSDAQLARCGLFRRNDGLWAGKPMAESARKSLRRVA
jgi:hypothetical protein